MPLSLQYLALMLIMYLATTTAAKSSIIAKESFEYSTSLGVNGLNGGTGWTTPWTATSGSVVSIEPTKSMKIPAYRKGNSLVMRPDSATTIAYRSIPRIERGTVYVAMLMDKLNVGTRYAGLELYDRDSLIIGFGFNTGYSTWTMWPTGLAGTAVIKTDVITDNPAATLLVLRVDLEAAGSRARLYVNPLPGSIEPPIAQADTTGNGVLRWSGIDRVSLSCGSKNSLGSTTRAMFDEIVIATSWSDSVTTGYHRWRGDSQRMASLGLNPNLNNNNEASKILSYALGTSDVTSAGENSAYGKLDFSEDRKTFLYEVDIPNDRDEFVYRIQSSGDLNTWSDETVHSLTHFDTFERRRARVPGTGNPQFFRLRVDAFSDDVDLALEPPLINTNPGEEYSDDQRSFAMAEGIAITSSGRIWVNWISGGDSEMSYVLAAYSDNSGSTWSEPRLVIDPHDALSGLRRSSVVANLWVDPSGVLWIFFMQSMGFFDGRGGVWSIRCENPDSQNPTWSAPSRITFGATLNKVTVLSSGEWLLPVSLWPRMYIKARNEYRFHTTPSSAIPADFNQRYVSLDPKRRANVFISKDQGESWSELGGVVMSDTDFNEHIIIELKDGRLWMLARTGSGIKESYSTNRGITWSAPRLRFPHVVSRFHVSRLQSGSLLLIKHGKLNERTPTRTQLRAYVSSDEGLTWDGGLLIDEREGVSYPDCTQGADGVIYMTYDRERSLEREILMACFTEQDIRSDSNISGKMKTRIIVNKASGP